MNTIVKVKNHIYGDNIETLEFLDTEINIKKGVKHSICKIDGKFYIFSLNKYGEYLVEEYTHPSSNLSKDINSITDRAIPDEYNFDDIMNISINSISYVLIKHGFPYNFYSIGSNKEYLIKGTYLFNDYMEIDDAIIGGDHKLIRVSNRPRVHNNFFTTDRAAKNIHIVKNYNYIIETNKLAKFDSYSTTNKFLKYTIENIVINRDATISDVYIDRLDKRLSKVEEDISEFTLK
jgi:hypothetical protein